MDGPKQTRSILALRWIPYASILLLGVLGGVVLMVVGKGPPQEIEAIQYNFQIVRSSAPINDLAQAMREHELGQSKARRFEVFPAASLLTLKNSPANFRYQFPEKELRSDGDSAISVTAIPTVREGRVFTTIWLHKWHGPTFSLALRENETRAVEVSRTAKGYWYLLVSHRTDVQAPPSLPFRRPNVYGQSVGGL